MIEMQTCYKCGATKPIERFYTSKKREPCKGCDVCRGIPPVQQKNKPAKDTTNTVDQDIFKMWLCFQADIDNFTDPLYKILPHVMAS